MKILIETISLVQFTQDYDAMFNIQTHLDEIMELVNSSIESSERGIWCRNNSEKICWEVEALSVPPQLLLTCDIDNEELIVEYKLRFS